MKVLFVLEYYSPHIGGAEVLFQNLCEGLASRGYDITVVTLKLAGTETYEIVNGVKIHRVRAPRKGDRYWFTFLSLPKAFAFAIQADLIHTTTYNGALAGWLAAKMTGKRSLITVHEVLGAEWENLTGMRRSVAKVHQWLERLITSLSFDRYVAVSKHTRKSLAALGVDRRKLSVVYNGIDYALFDAQVADGTGIRSKLNLSDTFIYMYYGRPGVSKGVEYLVQAVPAITRAIGNSKLLMLLASDPRNLFERVKKLITDLRVEREILLLSPVARREVPNYIAAADCVVVPSLSEGFGFTAGEACAMGKPVVASNVGSISEVVSGTYIMVKPRDAEAIAKAVVNVYNGRAKHSARKTFTWDGCINGYLDVYAELMGSRKWRPK